MSHFPVEHNVWEHNSCPAFLGRLASWMSWLVSMVVTQWLESQDVFFQIAKSICLNCELYLYKFQNVFARLNWPGKAGCLMVVTQWLEESRDSTIGDATGTSAGRVPSVTTSPCQADHELLDRGGALQMDR